MTTGRSSRGLREHGIPPAAEAWFDARATEDELLTGVYLKVRPRELLDELRPRPDQRVVAVEEGEALFFLGDRQMRIVRSGEVVRVPPELPHRIEDIGESPLRLDWLTAHASDVRSWPGGRSDTQRPRRRPRRRPSPRETARRSASSMDAYRQCMRRRQDRRQVRAVDVLGRRR